MTKIIRITTVPISLKILQKGQNKFLASHGWDILGVSSSGKEMKDLEKDEGMRTKVIEMTRTISPLKDLKALRQFYLLCKKEKPAIVHSHTPKAGIIGMLGAKLAGVPIRLHTVAGLPLTETSGLKRRMLISVEKLTYRCATKVFPISYGLKEYIINERIGSSSKIKVLGNGSSNGIDTIRFDPENISSDTRLALRRELNIPPSDFVYLFVGRVVTDKGVNELVSAFDAVNNTDPDCHLVIVGNFENQLDPLLDETEKRIRGNKKIHTVGYKDNVEEYLGMADVLCFPSYREGFGNVTAQAGAMGLPVIVTDITGSNEIVIDGKNGLIIPVKEITPLVHAMKKIKDEPELYENLKKNAREMITSRYDQKFVWEALLDEYRKLLEEKELG